MKQSTQGWALLEVVIAMAVMGVAASVVLAMQLQSVATIQRALKDAQSLGLAIEIRETQVMGLSPNTLEASWEKQLKAIDPNRRFEIVTTPSGSVVEIHASTQNSDQSSLRWQLPLEP